MINKTNSEDLDETAHISGFSLFSNVCPTYTDVRNYLTLPYSLTSSKCLLLIL